MKDEKLPLLLGEYLKESAEGKALDHFELMRFMTRNASAEIWAKADQVGL